MPDPTNKPAGNSSHVCRYDSNTNTKDTVMLALSKRLHLSHSRNSFLCCAGSFIVWSPSVAHAGVRRKDDARIGVAHFQSDHGFAGAAQVAVTPSQIQVALFAEDAVRFDRIEGIAEADFGVVGKFQHFRRTSCSSQRRLGRVFRAITHFPPPVIGSSAGSVIMIP